MNAEINYLKVIGVSMNVLIFYASYGGGHLSAANALRQYIEKNYPEYNVKMVDCMKYINKGVEKITTDIYASMAKDMPSAWGAVYALSNNGPVFHISNFNNKVMAFKLKELFDECKPDLVISTHPFSTQMTAWLKQLKLSNCQLASILTDFASQNQWLVGHRYTDYIFVSTEKMKRELIKKDIDGDKIYVTGIPLSQKFSQNFDRKEIEDKFNLDKTRKHILFFGGGELGLGKSKNVDVLNVIINNLKDKYDLVTISGKNEKMYNYFKDTAKNSQNSNLIHVLGFTDCVPELMSISELVVTKPGGLTSTESLASSLPMIIINPIPGQEYENAKFLVEHGVGIWIKKDDDCETIISNLLSDEKKLHQMKINAKLLAKRNSTQNICEILFGKLK